MILLLAVIAGAAIGAYGPPVAEWRARRRAAREERRDWPAARVTYLPSSVARGSAPD